LELLREPSYVYDLMKTLADYGFKRATEPGPARHYYKITDPGRELLQRRAYHLKRQMIRAQRLLNDYASLTGNSLPVDPWADEGEERSAVGGRSRQRR
jgi:DNA-binding PadR family transcriptional regulator